MFSPASRRAAASIAAVRADIEGLARDLHTGGLEDALAALVGGEGLPPGLPPEVLFSGGMPRVRPVLVLLASRARTVGRDLDAIDPKAAFEVACVAELLHGAIILHDAALGHQHGRRRKMARRVLRRATQWVGANHLTIRALEIARHLPSPEILGDLVDTLREVAEGQALDEALHGQMGSASDALHHAEGHTGAVFAFACRAGGHLSGADRQAVGGLSRYGRHVGVAWHLAEDMALFESPEGQERLGRELPFRPIYPVCWAAAQDPEVEVLWRQLGHRYSRGATDAIALRVRNGGGLNASREALVHQVWTARRALTGLPETPARQRLDQIAASLARAA